VSFVSLAAGLLGGIGLFLLGMRLMTDGLKVAAGESLKRVLGTWTSSRARGLLAGALITALVQSSSAVIVATIGFVNAGLLSLGQAVAVVFGSSVGTTMTGWVVAALGVRIQVSAFAVPLVGVGAILHLLGRGRRRAALGDALAGFGLFFLGIDLLRGSFEGIGAQMDLAAWALPGAAGVAIFVALGFALTMLTQSSSAALALVLTAFAGGVVPLASAAAAVVGCNVGTTSTSALAAIGATPSAKRVAAAHVSFNLSAGLVGLALLPVLSMAMPAAQARLGLDRTPVVSLAIYHTTFNVLGVALVWPFVSAMLRFLGTRFRTAEEDEARPRFLDRNVAGTPDLAMAALANELAHTRDVAHAMARGALAPVAASRYALEARRATLASLFEAVADFAARVGSRELPAELAELPPLALRVARYQTEVAARAAELARLRDLRLTSPDLSRAVGDYECAILETLDAGEAPAPSVDAVRAAHDRVEALYAALKSRLLLAGARGELPVDRLSDQLDRIRAGRRISEQAEKAARHLSLLRRAEPGESDRD
jgi:phosphate:Na+ symporter